MKVRTRYIAPEELRRGLFYNRHLIDAVPVATDVQLPQLRESEDKSEWVHETITEFGENTCDTRIRNHFLRDHRRNLPYHPNSPLYEAQEAAMHYILEDLREGSLIAKAAYHHTDVDRKRPHIIFEIPEQTNPASDYTQEGQRNIHDYIKPLGGLGLTATPSIGDMQPSTPPQDMLAILAVGTIDQF